MNHLAIIVAIFILTVVLGPLIAINEHFDYASYLNHKGKCYSCETQVAAQNGLDAVWMAQPTKGFSDEAESVAQTGSGWLAKTIKP